MLISQLITFILTHSPSAIAALLPVDAISAFLGVYNVKLYGAKGDGSTDDTAAIQEAIDALPSTGGAIYFPAGTYILSGSLTITQRAGVKIIGTGTAGGTGAGSHGVELRWEGNSSDPAIRIWGSHDCIFRDFTIKSSSSAPLAVGIRSETKAGGFYTGHNSFRNVQIDGTDATGLAIGWQWLAGSGGDGNNDENSFQDCYVFFYNDAAYDVTHLQSVGHKFFGGGFNAYRAGSASVGLRLVSGNFVDVYGWSGGGNTGADFSLSGNRLTVRGFHSENSARLLENGPEVFGGAVILSGVTFISSSSTLAADKKVIKSESYGELVLEGVYIDGAPSDPVEIYLHHATYPEQFNFTVNSLEIATSLANPFTASQPRILSGLTHIGTLGYEALRLNRVGPISYFPATPTTLSSDQNNYAPSVGGSPVIGAILRLSTNFSWSITGLTFATPQIDGQSHLIVNTGANTLTLKHQDTGSTAANRFLCSAGADIVLSANQAADVVYDGTQSRWLVFKRN